MRVTLLPRRGLLYGSNCQRAGALLGRCRRHVSARRLTACELIELVLDAGSWVSWDAAPDRSGLPASYVAALDAAQERSGADESVLTGEGLMHGRRVAVLSSEFGFLAGSIGGTPRIWSSLPSSGRPPPGCRCWRRRRPAGPGYRRASRRSCRSASPTAMPRDHRHDERSAAKSGASPAAAAVRVSVALGRLRLVGRECSVRCGLGIGLDRCGSLLCRQGAGKGGVGSLDCTLGGFW